MSDDPRSQIRWQNELRPTHRSEAEARRARLVRDMHEAVQKSLVSAGFTLKQARALVVLFLINVKVEYDVS